MPPSYRSVTLVLLGVMARTDDTQQASGRARRWLDRASSQGITDVRVVDLPRLAGPELVTVLRPLVPDTADHLLVVLASGRSEGADARLDDGSGEGATVPWSAVREALGWPLGVDPPAHVVLELEAPLGAESLERDDTPWGGGGFGFPPDPFPPPSDPFPPDDFGTDPWTLPGGGSGSSGSTMESLSGGVPGWISQIEAGTNGVWVSWSGASVSSSFAVGQSGTPSTGSSQLFAITSDQASFSADRVIGFVRLTPDATARCVVERWQWRAAGSWPAAFRLFPLDADRLARMNTLVRGLPGSDGGCAPAAWDLAWPEVDRFNWAGFKAATGPVAKATTRGISQSWFGADLVMASGGAQQALVVSRTSSSSPTRRTRPALAWYGYSGKVVTVAMSASLRFTTTAAPAATVALHAQV